MPEIARREWRWLAAASLVILLVYSAPYAAGWLSATPDRQFSGFLIGLEDMYSYIAKMHYAARDGWALQLLYTSEPHSGGYVYLPILALGKLTALVSGQGASTSTETMIAGFHVARVVCGMLLLVTMYVFVARFLAEPRQRRVAWLIAVAGGGFGWLEAVAQMLSGAPHLPPVEYYIPEAFTPLILLTLPHVALARALLLGGWLALIAAAETGRWRWAIVAGVMWLGVGLCVPFYTVLTAIVAGFWLTALGIAKRKLPLREAGMALLAGAMAGLYAIYNFWLFTTNPIFAVWSSQNVLPSPPLVEYAIAYGLIAALAAVGAIPMLRAGLSWRTSLIVTWPPAALIMAYLPINVQRRLLEAVIVPLAILAALGIERLRTLRPAWSRPGAILLAGLLGMSSLLFVVGEVFTSAARNPQLFHPADELAALDWLAGHAPADSIVLSTHQSGMMLPAYAPVRVYVGHGPETIHSDEKSALANRFFGAGMTDTDRIALLRANSVRYVWVGHQELNLACQQPDCFDARRLGLVEVFHDGEFSIDEVAP